jgi:hypothetical protein
VADLNTPKHRMLVARLNLQIHEQELVIEAKELRLLELAEEIENVKGDIKASQAHIVKLKAEASQQSALMKEQEAANG